jgi:hypothetical protein
MTPLADNGQWDKSKSMNDLELNCIVIERIDCGMNIFIYYFNERIDIFHLIANDVRANKPQMTNFRQNNI